MEWNEKKIKQEIRAFYAVPKPMKKRGFLRQFDYPYISMGKFMWEQLWYIKKWVWLLSGFIFAVAIWMSKNMEKEMVWILYALAPFLALTMLTESVKSNVYCMDELEYATRFSLKNLLLARMGALAILHGLMLLIITVCLYDAFLPIANDALYILVPYFLTVCIGFHILRWFRGRESAYVSMGISVFVSSLVCYTRQAMPFLYLAQMLHWWAAAFVAIALFTVKEVFIFYKKTEGLSWS